MSCGPVFGRFSVLCCKCLYSLTNDVQLNLLSNQRLDSFGDAMCGLVFGRFSVLCWSRLSSCANDVKLNLLSNECLEIFGDAL